MITIKPIKSLFWMIGGLLPLIFSCNEPSLVGGDLLSEDQSNIFYTDTISIQARTVGVDSVITYSPGLSQFTYLCGNYIDPLFGKVQANIYAQMRLSAIEPPFLDGIPEGGTRLDSVKLFLIVRKENIYGLNQSAEMELEVYELGEDIDNERDYYSSETLQKKELLGKYTVIPTDIADSLQLIIIPFLPDASNRLFNLGEQAYTSDEEFRDAFKGIVIEAVNENNYMMAFDLDNSVLQMSYFQDDSIFVDNTLERIDTIQGAFNFNFDGTSAKLTHFEHDYTDTDIVGALQNNTPSDTVSSLYVQGMSGVNFELTFPHLEAFSGAVINKAELMIHSRSSGLGSYPLPNPLLAYTDNDGSLEVVRDLGFAIGDSPLNRRNFALINNIANVFGGGMKP